MASVCVFRTFVSVFSRLTPGYIGAVSGRSSTYEVLPDHARLARVDAGL